MAVFMINICKFNGCGITFPSLGALIQHIEDTHIDYDPIVVEQKEASQPSCVPLSYVLKFFTEATRREFQMQQAAPEARRRAMSGPKTPSVRSSTPTGSEFDDEEVMTPSEDSNDSWTFVEEYSSEYILRYGVKMQAQAAANAAASAQPPPLANDKPFACPVPGCKKRYKNINGIKYHSKNGHKKDGKIRKPYKCHCGKSYKTSQALKAHSVTQRCIASMPLPPLIETPKQVKNMPGLIVTATNTPQPRQTCQEDEEGAHLFRIYEGLHTNDISPYHIPKITIVKDTSQIIRSGIITGNPLLKIKNERPKLTVQSGNSMPPPLATEHAYISKVI